jgi:pimeloyl-ACP methyl ester carboxylesterase
MNLSRFLADLERSDALKLANLLRRPTPEEAAVLRVHLGPERFERMHRLAHATVARSQAAQPKGNVVVIPGFLGSELTAFIPGGGQEPIWLNVQRLASDGFDRLRIGDGVSLDPDSEHVEASGVLKRNYGELLLALAARWNVQSFAYDWRKDLNASADRFDAWLACKFNGQPVHLVAHGSGGLVARAFIARHPERWESMRDKNGPGPGQRGGRLVMLGTPNRGSMMTVQALAGVAGFVTKLGTLKGLRDRDELLKVVLSFPGLYQLLPATNAFPGADRLYRGRTYSNLASVNVEVPQRHLKAALKFRESLRVPIGLDRTHVILGYGQPTYCGIKDFNKLDQLDAYLATGRGDGVVALDMARLDGASTYFIAEEHAGLTSNREVLAAIDELLSRGCTERLGPDPRPFDDSRIADLMAQAHERDVRRWEELTRQVQLTGGEASSRSSDRHFEESLTRDLLSPRQIITRRAPLPSVMMKHPRVELALGNDHIASLNCDRYRTRRSDRPVDAIAVGHYLGVKPSGSERELDAAISRAILDLAPEQPIKESDLVLTQYSERGILKGELGQPFFLPDPRDHTGNRIIAIAGMGVPGRFGWPELTVLARELIWSVGRLGKRHLAIASVGTRFSTVPLADTIAAWIRGLKNAVTGAIESEVRHIERLTILLQDPRLMEAAHDAVLSEIRQLEDRRRLEIEFEPFDPEELNVYVHKGLEWDEEELAEELSRRRLRITQTQDPDPSPTRVTLALEGSSYHFGALTSEASVPERAVPLDPVLVQQANARLAAETDPDRQLSKGQFLQRLLVPDDLRLALKSAAPLIMMLDRETAKIHWEMVAQAEPAASDSMPAEGEESDDPFDRKFEYTDYFLGTSRGFTRQLRTTFAPPPEPPPPPRRVLRVLVVANPAADAPLPGAEREGHEVADAFEAFNAVYEDLCENRVDVCRLIGPEQASRTEVLEHLMLRRYDVLHFAGHCIYDEKSPQMSGWVFGRDQRISAYELNRVDRVPRFVFSNACESGVLSGSASPYSPGLAPSFAESFFLRGVSNFVCTAWPVDDTAALEFAQWVYFCLLGLRPHAGPGPKFTPLAPLPMHAALRQARLRIAGQPHGVQTWGAYQHYGNPYLRFFDPEAMKTPPPVATSKAAAPAAAPAPSKAVEPDLSAGLIAALSDSPGITPEAARQPAVVESTGNGVVGEANPRRETRTRRKSARS